jgi:hypothetical protein
MTQEIRVAIRRGDVEVVRVVDEQFIHDTYVFASYIEHQMLPLLDEEDA